MDLIGTKDVYKRQEYIPKKTKEGNPVTVRVPLNDKAKEILERYKEYKEKLLPFISCLLYTSLSSWNPTFSKTRLDFKLSASMRA